MNGCANTFNLTNTGTITGSGFNLTFDITGFSSGSLSPLSAPVLAR